MTDHSFFEFLEGKQILLFNRPKIEARNNRGVQSGSKRKPPQTKSIENPIDKMEAESSWPKASQQGVRTKWNRETKI